jgi:hypothetical protein
LLASALALTAFGAPAAFAQASDTSLSAIEKQIQSLQAELRHMKAEAAQRDRELKAAQARAYSPPPVTNATPVMPQIPAGYALVPAGPGSAPGSVVLAKAEAPPAKKMPKGSFQLGGVTVTLGGFVEAAGVFRSRNEQTDLASSFTSGIPERESPLYHEPQTVLSARQSRITTAVSASPDEVTKLQGYFAADFLGAAPTANYNESNSWTPRLREAWIDYARSDLGLYVMGGQSWSLLTANKVGVNPLQIDLPLQIDPQYVVGLNWARQAQFRIAKNLGSDQFWIAASVENSATVYSGTLPTAGHPGFPTGSSINLANAGSGVDGNVGTGLTSVSSTGAVTAGSYTSGSYTTNFVPDVIVKGTADFDLAHFEAYGLGRVFNDRVSTLGSGVNHNIFGGGFGGDALIHIVPKLLDVHVSGLFGDGVGRYGTSQLPDATINASGRPVALPGYSGYAGVVGHPDADNDIYAYFGVEHVRDKYYLGTVAGKEATLAGFGSPLINNTSCATELLATPAACNPTTSGDAQITVGNWYKFLQGSYGTMQVGAQYSYTRRFVFQGIGTTPKTDDNMVFLSFRWYPFQ